MTIYFEPCDSVIGARVSGIALSKVPSDSEIEEIERGLEKHGVLVFPNQSITPAQQIAFSSAFAELEMTELEQARLPDYPEVFVVGNVGKGLVSFAPAEPDGELEWHTDHIHHEVPARASLLYALEIPERGGDTLFACMYHAYDALGEREKADYLNLQAIHSSEGLEHFLDRQNLAGTTGSLKGRQYKYVRWPLVRAHPLSGKKALYFGNQVTVEIDGWDRQASLRFVEELTRHACQLKFQYQHKWQVGDAVLWDNRRVLHAGMPYDVENTRRCLHRTTWRETEPITLLGKQYSQMKR